MMKTLLKKSLILLALALALTGCTDFLKIEDPVEQMSPEKKLAYDNYCIYFISDSAITLRTYNASKNWDGTLYYSIDLESWDEWDGTEISSGTDNKLYLRGIGNTVISDSSYAIKSFILNSENNISCYGNIMTLLDYEKVKNNEGLIMCSFSFNGLFSGCTSLTTAPDLPATNLGYSCYGSMFSGCTSLITAPDLPATNLLPECYYSMFSGCTSLTTVPELPATTLANGCYRSMFEGCTSLTTTPKLPAKTLAETCYYSMFSGCTSLITAPELPATSLAILCYYSMFSGCTSLITAPELPATTLADGCYYSMFSGCTSLTTAPKLHATTLADNCYRSMFYDCTSLTTAPELPATSLAILCYKSMFEGCTNIKVYETKPSETYYEWTAPLNPNNYYRDCYSNMFNETGGDFTGNPKPGTTYYILRP